jgi:hypothetical protein
MSRADESAILPKDGGPKQNKRRNLSLANITIPSALSSLYTLKRKPRPTNSPIAPQQRSLSLDSPKLAVPQPRNLLTPIASPGLNAFSVRDLDR